MRETSASRRTGPVAGFALQSETALDGLDATLSEHLHVATGMRHLHLATGDEDSAFVLAFRTPAPDSSGATHVLEHLVLCGSERYPCRRAFFAMLGRTLATAMNAYTTEDCTSFHFSTRSLDDYDNLMSVFLDAAFFPRLDALDFAQEGCRLDLEDPEDTRSALRLRGVVYSEMRGLENDVAHQVQRRLNRELFPDSAYRFDSGGDPRCVPELDCEAVGRYHARHYQPANALVLSAGSVQAQRLHARLAADVLDRRPWAGAAVALPEAPAWRGPARAAATIPVLAPGEQALAIAWVLGSAGDPLEAAAAELLARCLLAREDGALRRALAASGATLLPGAGVQSTRSRVTFHCGAIARGSVAGLARQALAALEASGALAHPAVAETLDAMERARRERDHPRYPPPLGALMRMLPGALYGGDPGGFLDGEVFAALREMTSTPERCAALVHRHLLDNPRRLVLELRAAPQGDERLEDFERAVLARRAERMDDEERRSIAARARALAARQAAPAGEDVLPALDVARIPTAPPAPALARLESAGVETRVASGPTGGLAYAHLAIAPPAGSPVLGEDLAAYCELLAHAALGDLSASETRARIASVCDGLGAVAHLLATGSGSSDRFAPAARLVISARALDAARLPLVELVRDAGVHARFESDGLARVLAEAVRRRSAEFTRAGHLHAQRLAAASLDPRGVLEERVSGVSALRALRETLDDPQALAALPERLAAIGQALRAAPRELLLVGEGPAPAWWPALERWRDVPSVACEREPARHRRARLTPHRGPGRAWLLDTAVNHCARVFAAPPADHPDAAALAVLCAALSGEHLEPSMRERGGAYGAGARYCPRSATVRLFSYRDPRAAASLADFTAAVDAIGERAPSGQALDRARLRALREMDPPRAFQARAREAYLDLAQGLGPSDLRERVMAAGPADLTRVAQRHLASGRAADGVLAGIAARSELESLGLEVREL